MSAQGHVSFVGAGPGDPDLLTVKVLKRLRSADVVLYDALVSEEILGIVRRGAQRFAVGKRAGTPCVAQREINRMLVALCRKGRHVVRLKGGDPAIFARLGEEIEAVTKAGFAFDIVPGITTASAAAAYSGIALTERGFARRVQFVTAHARAGVALELDWASLADPDSTSILYMARAAAHEISQRLMERGLSKDTPVLLMTDVSRASQCHYRTRLADMAGDMHRLPSAAPLIVIIGSVVDTRRGSQETVSSIAAIG